MMGSMFGAYAPPQQGGGGMFGQPQQSPLMQMLGGGGGGGGMNPQLLQLAQQLMAAGGPQRLPMGGAPAPSPMMGMGMGQPHGQVPMTLDQNVLRGILPQGGQSPMSGGLSPDLLRMLMSPRQI